MGVLERASVRLDLPDYGFGGASCGNLYEARPDESAFQALEAAMRAGMSYIDTAPRYGHGLSEVRIGKFLRRWDGDRPLLSTKVGRLLLPCGPEGPPDEGFVDPLPFTQHFDYSYDGVMRSFDDSCRRTGVETFDIIYMHDVGRVTHGDRHPEIFATAMDGGLRAMAELKADGRTQAIGLGVNEWEVCEESFGYADFDLFMLAGRYTLLEQTPLDRFLSECVRRGVGVVAAAPFNSGLLSGRPDASSRFNYALAPPEVVERATRLFDFCVAQGVSIQAAALQFPLLHPAILCVVSGMATADRVEQARLWAGEAIPPSFWLEMKSAGLLHPDAPVTPLKN